MVETTQVISTTTSTVLRSYNQFTTETDSESRAPFLDVLVIKKGLIFTFKVYRKPTDTGHYLNF
jgi:hypothetical protein